MNIKPEDIKVPLEKIVEMKNGNAEISISKMDETHAEIYRNFVSSYVSNSEASEFTKEKFLQEAVSQFNVFKKSILETSESGELTPAQKKLPPAIQKALLKKQGKKMEPEGKETKTHEKGETKDTEKMEDKSEAQKMDESMCEDGENGEPCGEESCSKCKAKASGQKTKSLSKDDKIPTKY